MVTALAMTLTPMLSVGFVIATPDGPLMAAWACSLYFAVRAEQTRTRRDFIYLGIALAAALLSKMFAFALLAGIVAWSLGTTRRSLWRDGLGLTFLIIVILCAPFLIWNAQNHWVTFTFAFEQRHVAQPSLLRPLFYLLVSAGPYSPGLWLGALLVLVRPRNALVAWTAIPLSLLLVLLNFHERIELHWIFGPYISLCVGMGLAFSTLSHRAQRAVGDRSCRSGRRADPVSLLGGRLPGAALRAVPRDRLDPAQRRAVRDLHLLAAGAGRAPHGRRQRRGRRYRRLRLLVADGL
jgi:4-amino-4-deoxy-L-arabinose transferase-like glycosyltransferase